MSFIGSMFSNSNGSGFKGQSADLTNPINTQQVQQGIGATNQQLGNQQALVNALAAQGGLGNQSQVYNQLQGIASGTGPNPALAQLQQTTGQNVANQAALMAGQRGAGSNAGLLARQAAQQGAATQQQAVGQAATLAAQQQLGAIGQAGSLASQQAQQQIGATQAMTQAQQAQQNALLSGNLQGQQQQLQNVQQQNAVNAQIASGNQAAQTGLIGGALSGVGSALGLAKGGEIPHMADGGQMFNLTKQGGNTNPIQSGMANLTSSGISGLSSAISNMIPTSTPASNAIASNVQSNSPMLSGNAPNQPSDLHGQLLSGLTPRPQGANLMPQGSLLAKGGQIHNMKTGGHVPGKAKVTGSKDSYSNDTVPAILSPGEIVLPRSVTQSQNPTDAAAKFVAAIKSKKGKSK